MRDSDYDIAFADGMEELARRIVEFIDGMDFEVTAFEVVEFIEFEIGAHLVSDDFNEEEVLL